jgi:hypothetical protein
LIRYSEDTGFPRESAQIMAEVQRQDGDELRLMR